MTGKEILSLMRDRLREVCPEHFTDSYLVQELNAAQNVVAARTRCLVDSATTTVFVGVQKYSIPLDCIRIISVEYGGKRLEQSTIAAILDAESASDTPNYYAVFADELWLYPVPDTGDTMRIYYARRPAAIQTNSLTTVLDLPDEWCQPVVNLAVANVLQVKGDNRATGFFTLYEKNIQELLPNVDPDPTGVFRWVQVDDLGALD